MLRLLNLAFNAAVVVAIVAAAVLWWRSPDSEIRAPSSRPPIEAVRNLRIPAGKAANIRGTGPVALVEFADYECPFCARHASDTAKQIDRTFLAAGVIRHVYFHRPLPSHLLAQMASEAAECAAVQGRFWEMHRLLFDDSASLELDGLQQRAASAGTEQEAFRLCLRERAMLTRVRSDIELAQSLNVLATPTFFVGVAHYDGAITLLKRINGALEFDYFSSAINEVQASGGLDARHVK